jgi:lipid-A-disaccharide synthase
VKIAIVAAEASGDVLAAKLITTIKQHYPRAKIIGMVGDKSTQAGATQIWHSNLVSVMGFVEVIKKLPFLLLLRQKIIKFFLQEKVDIFIGVDSPDFNFYIEKKLKAKGIKAIHFVSPSIWAWREERIKKIKQSTDIMLCLLPFEVKFYQKHNINAYFVGHPLASELEMRLEYLQQKRIVLMPGSRISEIENILPIMVKTANNILRFDNEYEFHIPLVNNNAEELVKTWIKGTKITYSIGDAYTHIKNSDLVVVASGTASLEVALIGTPQVVVYKMHPLSYKIASKKLKSKFVSLPNIILDKQVIIELIQDNYNQATLVNAIFNTLKQSSYQIGQFSKLEEMLSADFDNGVISAINFCQGSALTTY